MSDIIFQNIETERLILRKFKESDADRFFTYRTDPQVALHQGDGWKNYTRERAEEFIQKQMNFEPGIPGTWFQIAIEYKDKGMLIGDLAIHTLAEDINQVEIGFTINPLYQRKGFGIEAVRHILGYIFKEMNKHRVIAKVDVRNIASYSLLEKVGMRREGYFIQNAWYNGEYTDEYWFGLLQAEWK